MNSRSEAAATHDGRAVVLWTCTALFLLRVVAQIEVLLLAPAWLPPMQAWYSGLLPYPLLLPAQIGILIAMGFIGGRNSVAAPLTSRWHEPMRMFALCYFSVMVLRLGIQLLRGTTDVIDAGGIPIAFHWILALYLLVLSRARTAT